MRIALVSPGSHTIQHRVRGSGFYIENLKNSLLKYDKKNIYVFPKEGKAIPSDVDLVHYPYFEPFFLTLPIFKKKRTIVTVHDLIPLVFPEHFPRGLKGGVKWLIQKLALRNSEAIITDSNSSRKDIMKFVDINEDMIHVVHLAASDIFKQIKEPSILASILDSIEGKYKLPKKFVLYVGDVTWNKNLPRLIEAVKKADIPLVMVGKALTEKNFDKDNPWNKDLTKVQEMVSGDDRIVRIGFVTDDELVMLYNLATVFVMPSLYEGFGLPVLEAMSCGCPVVTSKEGSLTEVGGEAVYYINPYDASDIANGIGEVYFNTKVVKELSQKGIIQAKKFSWKKTAEKTAAVYKKVLE